MSEHAPLEGRSALVTGASAGIGLATARALAAAGARVTLTARRRERLEAAAASFPDGEPQLLAFDVRDAAAVRAALEGRVFDIVVLNAGLGLGLDKLQDGDPADWSEMIDTNVKGVLHVYRAVAPGMIARGRGDVVTLGSVAGRQVYPGGNVYCATKFAVRAVYEAMRLDAHGTGLRFCTVDPGMVQTDFSLVRFKGDAERAAKVYAGVDPLRPEDVAECILFAVTRPPHVNVGELVVWASAQGSTTLIDRRS